MAKEYAEIAAALHRSRMVTEMQRNSVRREAGLAALRLAAIDIAATLAAVDPGFDRAGFVASAGGESI